MSKLTFNPETHEYFLDGVKIPGVNEILTGIGLSNLSFVNKEVLKSNSKFGRAVHVATELWDKKQEIQSLSEPLIPYFGNWKKFVSDYKVEMIEIEKKVYSRLWFYAGTLDRVAKIKNRLTLLDIKSSDNIYPETSLQTVGYKIAYEELTKKKIQQRWCVQLTEKRYKVIEYKEDSDASVFLGAVNLYKWMKKNNKLKGDNKNGKC